MARNGTHSKRVAEYFAANPGKALSVSKLKTGTGIGNAAAISGAISYLNAKHRKGQQGGMDITTLTRGQSWAYYPATSNQPPEFAERTTVTLPNTVKGQPVIVSDEEASERLRRLADKLGEAEHRDQTHQVLRLTLVGISTEGHNIGKDEDTGNVFKVVPV